MGRRKIEIKAIKDERNRSVTFLKRKGGLFKKAHELSVLCSVDVAVFIFGSNKKLYEYSSSDMRDLITRYQYHGGPNEHKGPSDFNGGADEEDDEDGDGTPPLPEGMDHHMMAQHFQGQPQFPPHIRHHTPSASPPMPNGVAFAQHAAHTAQRAHTPQPPMGSRPGSRNDMRRMGQNMGAPPIGTPGPQGPSVNGYAYMPHPAIYNPHNPPNMPQQGHQFPYPPPPPHQHQMQPYMENHPRQSSVPPNFPPQHPPHPQHQQHPVQRHSVSPPQQHHQLASQQMPQPMPQPMPHPSPQPPQHTQMQSPPLPQQQQEHSQQQQHQQPPPTIQEPPPPPPVELKTEAPPERPGQPFLDTASAIKKMPQRKQHSIFTPVDENRSMLSQHMAAFSSYRAEDHAKHDQNGDRAQSVDAGSVSRNTNSPPLPKRADTDTVPNRHVSLSSIPETSFTPPSSSNSLRVGGGPPSSRPRLKVQIPDEASEAGSNTESASAGPGPSTDATSQTTRRGDSHSSGVILPPPSPSASTLLSAGATGPPNPFARPAPSNNQNHGMNIDTPVSSLPSRFMHENLFPSPSSFFQNEYYRGNDSNTLPSPLNFTTPVVGTGPSFLRDEVPNFKRKSPDISTNGPGSDAIEPSNEPKRLKVEN